MPQTQQTASWVLYETDSKTDDTTPAPCADKREMQIIWKAVIFFALVNLVGMYGAYLFLARALWSTCLFTTFLYLCSVMGVTVGAHRLWSHKSFKARLPLRVLLIVFNTIACQLSVLNWARDHRMHHKYSETDADPHNATRGLFFSHIGWLLVKKHPEIKAKSHTIDMSGLWADPVLRFQKKYYLPLVSLACFILPTYIPTLWGETIWNAYFVCGVFRFAFTLNVSSLGNSAAHKWGSKPYDRNITPVENKLLTWMTFGEGFHNYHHTFPWDYKAAGIEDCSLNVSKLFIDTMAKIGWAYDLKTVSDDVVEKRVKRTGDGSRKKTNSHGIPYEESKNIKIY